MISMVARAVALLGTVALLAAQAAATAWPQSASLPPGPLAFGAFTGEFRPDGTFSVNGQGWPAFTGTWKAEGNQVELLTPKVPSKDCGGPGRYTVATAGTHVTFTVVNDACTERRMIFGGSTWRPAGEPRP